MEIDAATQEKVGKMIVAMDGYFAIANALGCDQASAIQILDEEMQKAQATLHLDGIDAIAAAQARLLNKA